MPTDSDSSPIKGKKAKACVLETSSSSDEEYYIPVRKRKSRQRVSSTSTDSDESFIVAHTHKKIRRVLSDDDSESCSSSSSDSEVEGIFQHRISKKKPQVLRSDSESSIDFTSQKKSDKGESGSQSSDDDSEKCIICFKAFRGVIAHPSGCRHNFHSECLLTWSKTSNTCPIDRVKYTEVIVTSEGGIVNRHEVTTPPPQDHDNDIEPDDPTFCEICHQHDREHEMLLCDRCEAGYHLNCLDPPLPEVPVGDWFCPRCDRYVIDDTIDDDEVNDLLQMGNILESRFRHRTPAVPRRIGPRTRAAQRVIASIRQMAEQAERYQPSSSRSTGRRSQRTKKSHWRRSTRYKVELVTVEDGSTIEVKVAVNTRSRRKTKRKSNASCGRSRKSSKRTSASAGGVDSHRGHNSIIQPLDIVGSRPQLEYFSGCEAEDELEEDGGLAVLRARSNVATARGMANRKQIAAQVMRSAPRRPTPRIAVSSAPPDLLSSILDEQTKWHSPNAVIKSNSNGEVKVILPSKSCEGSARQVAGNGEASGGGGGSGVRAPPSQQKESVGGSGERNGESSSSSSIPPLQPPPQPVFSRVYEDEDFDLYADIEPPYVKS